MQVPILKRKKNEFNFVLMLENLLEMQLFDIVVNIKSAFFKEDLYFNKM